jgi:hypothetical protein
MHTSNRRVSEQTAAAAYLRADSALALTAAVVNRMPCHSPELRTLRAELSALGYAVRGR